MSKKEPIEADKPLEKADETQPPLDEFNGQGGSYVIDPKTNQRIKNIEE